MLPCFNVRAFSFPPCALPALPLKLTPPSSAVVRLLAVGVSGLSLRRELAMPHHDDTPEAAAAAQANPCSRRRLAMPHEEGDR
jgi:hypothetical protein